MTRQRFTLVGLLPSFENKDEFFEMIARDEALSHQLWQSGVLFTVLTFFYGLVMGFYSGAAQALAAAVKVPVLFFLSLLICFPAFFLLQFFLGSKMRLSQMASIILAGFVQTAAIMVSFTPIVVLFVLTGGNYHFLQLLHVAIFVVSGLFGMKTVLDALKYSCEKKAIYPQTGVVVFRFWVVILAFVGIQLAWNLRPFLAEKDQPFALFRKYEGNFYAAVIYSIGQLSKPDEDVKQQGIQEGNFFIHPDTTKGVR